jgi:hypothetical protein
VNAGQALAALGQARAENTRLLAEVQRLRQAAYALAACTPTPDVAQALVQAYAENARLSLELQRHQEAVAHLVAFQRELGAGLVIDPDRPGCVREG